MLVKLFFANQNRYEGDFMNEELQGQGIMYYANGERYEGDFAKNKREGQGKLYQKDGSLLKEGAWQNDQLIV